MANAAASSRSPDPLALVAALQQAFASPGYRPPTLPAAALEVMQLTRRPDAQFGDVVKVLDRDPVLAARMLSIAQSPMYAGRAPVLSLQQAAIRLGLQTVRDLALEAALHTRVFRVPGYDDVMSKLYRHSIATAHVARMVCKRAGVGFEYGFLAGLLHDVGFAAGLLALVAHPEWRGAQFAEIAAALNAVHVEASGQLADRWALPPPLREAIGQHHTFRVDDAVRPGNAALIVAEQLCWEAGAGMAPPPPDAGSDSATTPAQPADGLDVTSPEDVQGACEALSLQGDALVETRREAFRIVGTLGERT